MKKKLNRLAVVTIIFMMVFIVPASASNYYDGKLAWAASRDSNWEIYTMNEDGTDPTRLTVDGMGGPVDQHPVFVPDGTKIVWTRDFNIWIMNVDGTDKQQLTTSGMDNHPWVNPGGTKIYYITFSTSNPNRTIMRMNLDGTGQEALTGSDASRWHPSVRSDELIVYSTDTTGDNRAEEIRTLNPNTLVETTIYAPGWHVSAPTWDPTGTRIVLSEDHNGDTLHRIISMDSSGGNIQVLTDGVLHDITPYYKYPTGGKIDFVRNVGGINAEIFRMDSNGANQINLTNHPTPDLIVVETGSCSPILPNHPYIESSDSGGIRKDIFSEGEQVFAFGHGYPPSSNYPLYVVQDKVWNHNDPIPSPISTATVTTDGNGEIIPVTLIWNSAVSGEYDIIVDVNGNGRFDSGKDALDDLDIRGAGFIVVPEFPVIALPVLAVFGIMFLMHRKRIKP